jgi:tol-pal system protein YbgF
MAKGSSMKHTQASQSTHSTRRKPGSSALRRVALAAAMLSGWAVLPAQAGIFDDDEARRAILELRTNRTADQEAVNAKLNALSVQLDTLRRSMLEINTQLEQMKSDMAHQRGQGEVIARDVAEMQRRQKDLQQGINERVAKLEPQSVTLDGKTFMAEADEKREFEEAIARMRQADFAGGTQALAAFLKKYPATGYKESVLYWLGNAHYGLREYKEAIVQFRSLLALAPQHMRASEALLSIANCQSELKDAKAARKTTEELVKAYPDSEAAQVGRERLSAAAAGGKGK